MARKSHLHLSRRERQIMEIIYQHERAAAAEVLEAMPDPPSYSAVRAMLRVLEEKGHLKHDKSGRKYVYSPTLPREKALSSALRNMLQTFFNGSVEEAVVSLLDLRDQNLTDEELDRLSELIDKARKEGR